MASKNPKFRELILYLAKLSEADPRCGRTKLNKLLFYCDFRAYDSLGISISGQPYQKREFGPTPKALMPVVSELEGEGACAWADRTWHGRPMKRLVALREPHLSVFRPEEIDLIRNIVEELWPYEGSEISEKSHAFAGWQASASGEEIPYNTVFVDDARPLSEEEESWALSVIERGGLSWSRRSRELSKASGPTSPGGLKPSKGSSGSFRALRSPGTRS